MIKASLSKIVQPTHDEVHMKIEAILKKRENKDVQSLIVDTVEKSVINQFVEADTVPQVDTLSKFYQIVEQIVSKATYRRRADGMIYKKIIKWAESLNLNGACHKLAHTTAEVHGAGHSSFQKSPWDCNV